MHIKVDPASSTSVYLQICDQVKYAVAVGALQPGDRLPPIREVAAKIRVNRNTVARSYAELERDGVIVSRHGQGSFIAAGATLIQKRERLRVLQQLIQKVFVEAYHFQISPQELQKLWREASMDFGQALEEESA